MYQDSEITTNLSCLCMCDFVINLCACAVPSNISLFFFFLTWFNTILNV